MSVVFLSDYVTTSGLWQELLNAMATRTAELFSSTRRRMKHGRHVETRGAPVTSSSSTSTPAPRRSRLAANPRHSRRDVSGPLTS